MATVKDPPMLAEMTAPQAERATEIVLIDLSSIAHPIWHMSQSEPDPNHASQQIVARVRALASDQPHVAICVDSGRSFRKDIAPSYKGNRPPAEAMLHHQIDLAREQLVADGFPVWAEPGFEADDLIASGVTRALANKDTTVLIVSSDKDLLQLVGPRVRAKSVKDGSIYDTTGVLTKFGVRPEQMRDYLTLVGDTSDNIKGAPKVGPVNAAKLLAKYQTIEGIYDALQHKGTEFTPALATSLREFLPNLVTTRELISLRTDVPLPFDQVFAARVPKVAEHFEPFENETDESDLEPPTVERPGQSEPDRVEAAKSEVTDLPGNSAVAPAAPSASGLNTPTSIAVREPEVMAPTEYERQLDPRSMKDAIVLAKHMHDSRMFSAYGTPQGVLATVMLGRELGMPAMASLRGIHIIEGKQALAAQTMVALILKSGLAHYFKPVSFSETEATYVTHRKGEGNEPIRLTHTIEMARQAWPNKNPDWERSFLASGWGRNPTDMLCARASSRLARMVYPDIVGGLYTPDELSEIRGA